MNDSTTQSNHQNGDRQRARRLMWLSLILALLGACAVFVDLYVSQAFLHEPGPIWKPLRSGLRSLCKPAEAFGHGVGALIIVGVLYATGAVARRQWWRFLAMVYGSGLLADAIKLCVQRIRPKVYYDLTAGFPGGSAESFESWFPWLQGGYQGQSFPSAHTAVAVGLAIYLSHRFPRGRGAFIALAAATALQRIVFGHHYLSDCLMGAAVACFCSASYLLIGNRSLAGGNSLASRVQARAVADAVATHGRRTKFPRRQAA